MGVGAEREPAAREPHQPGREQQTAERQPGQCGQQVPDHRLRSTSRPRSCARSPIATFDSHSTPALSSLPKPITWAPWPTSYPPVGSFCIPSTGTPTAVATALIAGSAPVSPVNAGSNRSRYFRIAGPSSRAGSVVMNRTCTWLRVDSSSLVSADAMSASTVLQTSGQFVYPKNTSVTGLVVDVTRLNSSPWVSVSEVRGIAYGRSSTAPRNPFGSACGLLITAPPGLSALSAAAPQPATSAASTATTTAGTAFTTRLTAGSTGGGGRAFPADALGERPGEPRHLGRTVRDRLDQRRADDHRIRVRRHGGGLVRIRHAESDADRQGGRVLGPAYQFRRQVRGLLAGAGDTHHRGRVDEPAAVGRGHRDPLVRR